MDISLAKLPWYAQVGAFLVLALAGVGVFVWYYELPFRAEMEARETQLTALKNDIAKGQATAKQLAQFRAQVDDLEGRLGSLRAVLPEEKDAADLLRRMQTVATQSNLTIKSFKPAPVYQAVARRVADRASSSRARITTSRSSSTASASSRGSSTSPVSTCAARSRPTRTRRSSRSASRRRSSCSTSRSRPNRARLLRPLPRSRRHNHERNPLSDAVAGASPGGPGARGAGAAVGAASS